MDGLPRGGGGGEASCHGGPGVSRNLPAIRFDTPAVSAGGVPFPGQLVGGGTDP